MNKVKLYINKSSLIKKDEEKMNRSNNMFVSDNINNQLKQFALTIEVIKVLPVIIFLNKRLKMIKSTKDSYNTNLNIT